MEQLLWVDSCHSRPPLRPWLHLLTFYFLSFSVWCSNQTTLEGVGFLKFHYKKNLGNEDVAKESKISYSKSSDVNRQQDQGLKRLFLGFEIVSTVQSIHK